MTKRARNAVLGLMAFSLATWAAPAGNLSGTWRLNIQKSNWGKHRRPVSVVVTIEHNEPVLKYTGAVMDADGDSRTIAFDKRIDGKEYPAETGSGSGKITVARVDASTLSVLIKSDDGRYVQTIRTALSRDGKVLTRRLQLKAPDGEQIWTEVYERE
jgi:hypothetical protein